MKKKLLKFIVSIIVILCFISIFSSNNAFAEKNMGPTCDTYCPNSGLGCFVMYSDGTSVYCPDAHT